MSFPATAMKVDASNYWADWDPLSSPSGLIRKDTRIYWLPQSRSPVGECVGTFIGENPGGAQSIHGLAHVGYSPIEHRGKPGDPTLRLLLGIWQHASSSRGFQPQRADYVEVLNTYYFRDTKSGHALSAWRDAGRERSLFSESMSKNAVCYFGVGFCNEHLRGGSVSGAFRSALSSRRYPEFNRPCFDSERKHAELSPEPISG